MRFALLLPALTLLVPAAAADVQEGLGARLNRAPRLSTEGLRQLQAELAVAALPPAAKAYHEAHLAYLSAARRAAGDAKQDQAALDRAIKALEGRSDAESMALLGACLGVKIGFAPMSGISLSPKASALFEGALQKSPGNPRVLLLQGIHVLHTPAFFGGGAEAALPALQAAAQAAAAEPAPADGLAPAWGRVESLVWLAQAQRKLGKEAEAQASLKAALALDPAYGYAQALLAKAGQ